MTAQWTEIYLLVAILVAFGCFLVLLVGRKESPEKKSEEKKKNDETTPTGDTNVLEVFDYLGTKIIHENGTYTVNHGGKVSYFKSWLDLPGQFKKMVKELDNRSQESKSISEDYFLESINGKHYLTMPGGKKRKYNSINEIPAHIRKAIGK